MDWKRALDLAVGDAPIEDKLSLLVQAAAEQWAAKAAIFIVDEIGLCLRLVAVEGLPDAYRAIVDPFGIGPDVPSCGTAAHTGQRVIVRDVERDPLWAPYVPFARAHGIRCCWSTPIRSPAGRVAGVLAVYHGMVRDPGADDLEAMDLIARTSAFLIERNRSVAEREASEALLSSMLDHLPVGVAVYDRQGRVTRINAAMRRFAGDVMPSMDERDGERWRGFAPDGTPVARMDFPGARALRGETVVPGVDFRYRQDDGSELWARVSAAPLRNEAGEIIGAVAVATDIDAAKRAEQELTAALAEARQNELVAHEMSHRFMNGFQLLHSVLSIQMRSIADPQALRVVEQAFTRVKAMAVVHRRLFEATRRDLAALDVADYLRGLVDQLAAAFADGDRCRVTAEVPVSLQMPTGRASSLGLITTELILNALKHAFPDAGQDGGLGQVAVRFDRHGEDGYRLTVADNGVGLPEGLNVMRSSGTGMTLVDGLVRQLDGTLDIERTRPGTRFVVTLPG
ncbi:sensor histidine kinase [Azospirillum canadense]|uniref:sensor histidine kinase n=1 Tax=Azospirillum canadense TaxID=403962 RepID=UPI0022271DF5|nr:GAF domain-containing protein [Azospirillum canadense]MCW2244001.1 PAS domain S-box-containing protein [Azospirillum canadense]